MASGDLCLTCFASPIDPLHHHVMSNWGGDPINARVWMCPETPGRMRVVYQGKLPVATPQPQPKNDEGIMIIGSVDWRNDQDSDFNHILGLAGGALVGPGLAVLVFHVVNYRQGPSPLPALSVSCRSCVWPHAAPCARQEQRLAERGFDGGRRGA